MPSTVSVVIPSYNRASYLPQAVGSVLDQTRLPEEILVVDDGSTDNTAEVVSALRGPVRYLHQSNRGAGAARNYGIREAKGDYVALLDTDDLWFPEKLARQVAILDQRPEVGLVHSASELMDEGGVPTGEVWGKADYHGRIYERLLFANGVNASSVLVRRHLLLEVGAYDEAFPLLENWELWLRLSKVCEFAYQEAPMTRYRVHKGNAIGDLEKLKRSIYLLQAKHILKPDSTLSPGLRRQVLARHHEALADAYVGKGRLAPAREEFFKSLFYKPLQPDVLYRLFRVSTSALLKRDRAEQVS